MSEPSYWALFTDKMAIFRFLNLHLLRGFLVQSSLKSFSLLQMFNRLNSGKRKGGKGGWYWGEMERDPVAPFPFPLYIPSQYFQWGIPWYTIQANSHVMYWLFWQLSKTSGWNFLVFQYYALPSKDLHNLRYTIIIIIILLWLLSYRLASILYIVFKKGLRESHLVFLHNHVFKVLFVCLLVFASFIFYKFTEPAG